MSDEKNETEGLEPDISEFASPEEAETEPESTIFTKKETPEKKTKARKKQGGLIKIIVAVLAVAILLGGFYAVIRFIPVPEGEDSSSSGDLMSIPVLEMSAEDVERITVETAAGSFTVYSEKEDGEGENLLWMIEGIDPTLTDSSALETMVSEAVSVSALRRMKSISGSFGFNSPAAVVRIFGRGDTPGATLTVGAQTADQSGYYARVSDDAVYVISDYYYNLFTVPATDYAITDIINTLTESDEPDYFSDQSLYRIDYMTLSGSDYPRALRFEANPVSTYGVNYVMTAPYSRYADDSAMQAILSIATNGLSADSLYSYTADPAILERYGLNSPRVVFGLKIGKAEYTLRVGREEDGSFAVMKDGVNAVYKVAGDKLTFLNVTETSCLSSHIIFEDIKSLKSVHFTAEGLSSDFRISYAENELTVTLDGKVKSAANFKNLYYYLIALQLREQSFLNESGKELLRVEVNFNDPAKTATTAVFTEISDRVCLVTVDGVTYGKLPKSRVTDIISYAAAVRDGKEVPSIK